VPSTTEISVHTTGSISQMPDIATVDVTVNTTAQNATQATSRNSARYAAIVRNFSAVGIPASTISVISYNLYYNPRPKHKPEKPVWHAPYGYTVYRSFAVHLTDVTLVGKVIDASLSGGATGIDSMAYGIAHSRSLRNRALALAVHHARAAAESIARAAGMRVLRMLTVEVDGSSLRDAGTAGAYRPAASADTYTNGGSRGTAIPTVIAPSPIWVSDGINATFLLGH